METRLLEIGAVTLRARIGTGEDKSNILFDSVGETAWKSFSREDLKYLTEWAQGLLGEVGGAERPSAPKKLSGVTPVIRTTPLAPELLGPLESRRAESTVPFKQVTSEQSTSMAVGEASFMDFSEGKPVPKGTVRIWDGGKQ